MQQAFTTTYGSIVFERGHLYIKNVDVPFSRTTVAKIGWEVLFVLVFLMQFYRTEGTFYIVRIIFWGLLLISRFPKLFELLFRRSYANRIPVRSILSFEQEEAKNGLEVIVRLRLSSGRYREILFRKLEKQLEPFTEYLSQYLSAPKFA